MDTTSTNARNAVAHRSERQFLEDQVANARTAMVQTLNELKKSALGLVGMPSCAKQHPWLVTGSAVAAGFAAGALLTRSPQKHAGSTLRSSGIGSGQSNPEQAPPPTAKATWSSSVGAALGSAAMTVLQGALTAAAVSLLKADASPHDENAVQQGVALGDFEYSER